MSNKGRRSYSGGAGKRQAQGREINNTQQQNAASGKGGRRMFPEDVSSSRKKKTALLVIVIILAVIMAVFAVVAGYLKSHVKAPDIPKVDKTEMNIEDDGHHEDVSLNEDVERGEGAYTFLVCGTDKGGGNTDTMMVVKYDVTNQEINVMSIPRDTCINVSWGVKKINSAYANGGIEGLKKEIKKIMGFSVDYYILVDLQAFVEIVDTIGGVDFDVPLDMNYYDPTQNLTINIPAGYQHLDGENALKVARFRSGYASADIGRIDTQQDLLMAIAQQTLDISNLTKVGEFAQIFKDYVETDLTLGELTWLATQMMSIDTGNINFMTLPTDTTSTILGLSYCTIYVNDLVEMVNEYFNPYETPITSANLNILTLDGNGNIYATSGTIAGEFADYRSITGLGGATEQENEDAGGENDEGAEGDVIEGTEGDVIEGTEGDVITGTESEDTQTPGTVDQGAGGGTVVDGDTIIIQGTQP